MDSLATRWVLSFLLVSSCSVETLGESLEFASFAEILERYTIVADFHPKEAQRRISSEVFWNYPYVLPRIQFPIDLSAGADFASIPPSFGQNRGFEHLNRGRVLYLSGHFEKAIKTWLAARFLLKDPRQLGRANYFIASAYLQLGARALDRDGSSWEDAAVSRFFVRASSFYKQAYKSKEALKDPLLFREFPNTAYRLAAIYHRYRKFDAALLMATRALLFLQRSKRKEHRFVFRRIAAEALIANREYLKAAKILDQAISQDPSPLSVSKAFARLGDMYFDLNNYELAADMYALSHGAGRHAKSSQSLRPILRGESLFWQGKFAMAQQHFRLGLKTFAHTPLDADRSLARLNIVPWAYLRIADAYLARLRATPVSREKLEKKALLQEQTEVAYFRVIHRHSNSPAADYARIRLYCLQEDRLKKSNLNHMRDYLASKEHSSYQKTVRELAAACRTRSFVKRESGIKMLRQIKEFSRRFPNSEQIAEFVTPVKRLRAKLLDELIRANEYYKAIDYYETQTNILFRKLSSSQGKGLFKAYLETRQVGKANSFVKYFDPKGIRDWVRLAVYDAETDPGHKIKPEIRQKLLNKLQSNSKKLAQAKWISPYLDRISSSSHFGDHHTWILKAAYEKSKFHSKDICTTLLPLLGKSLSLTNFDGEAIASILTELFKEQFPALLKGSPSCSQQYIDIEELANRDHPREYASRWLNRLEWPMDTKLLETVWRAAETLHSLDHKRAKRLWNFLAKKFKKNSTKYKLIQIRLDRYSGG